MIESKHKTQEGAIAAALEASEPGDVVEIHASDCPLSAIEDPTDEEIERCGCAPLIVHATGAES